MAASMSRECGLLSRRTSRACAACSSAPACRPPLPRIESARALEHMSIDKKVIGGRVRLVLLEAPRRGLHHGGYPDAALEGTLRCILEMSAVTPHAGRAVLAPYAAHDDASRGRRFPEPPPEFRSEFQRDRDRIIHSNAFRRLAYKTQVFVNHEGDLYRTRVTHSIEVAQIARSIARALALNETLVEAISLAHDLGHTPFGHAGQDALNECMREYGGFEHNLQSLRVVDELEERYADFPRPQPHFRMPRRHSQALRIAQCPGAGRRSARASSIAPAAAWRRSSPILPTRSPTTTTTSTMASARS